MRSQEMKALSEAISALSKDATERLSSAPSLFQMLSSGRRERAATVLREAATRLTSSSLSVLSSRVELDSFEKVRQAIDDLVKQLKQEQIDEGSKKGQCDREIRESENGIARQESSLQGTEDNIANEEELVKTTQTTLKENLASFRTNQQALHDAGVNRATQSAEFQRQMSEQQETQRILTVAMTKLAAFYDRDTAQVNHAEPAPVPQTRYEAHRGHRGVLQLISELIEDAKRVAQTLQEEEQKTVTEYGSLVVDMQRTLSTFGACHGQQQGDLGITTVVPAGVEGREGRTGQRS
jgi:chromosome segregation ATPase